jgi:hypothetical protein
MTDVTFVVGAYVVVLGSLLVYALSLRRRSSAAAAAERAIEHRLDQR